MEPRRGFRGDPRRVARRTPPDIGGDILVRLADREMTGTFETLDRGAG